MNVRYIWSSVTFCQLLSKSLWRQLVLYLDAFNIIRLMSLSEQFGFDVLHISAWVKPPANKVTRPPQWRIQIQELSVSKFVWQLCEILFLKISTCSKTDENILLAWKRNSTGGWWTWGLDHLQQSWWNICPPLKSISCWSCSLFPWFWNGSINIFLSTCTKPASLYKEYLRFSNQDLDVTDLRQSLLIIINHHMSKDFGGQRT